MLGTGLLSALLLFGTFLGIGPFNDASWQSTFCKVAIFGLSDLLECDNMKDTLTFRNGGGVNITMNPTTDTITFTVNATTIAFEDLSNVTDSGCAAGQIRQVNGSGWYVCVTPSSGGEANTASNVGTGEASVFKQKSGVDLQFKKLKQGANVVLTNGTDDVTISVSGVGTGNATMFNDLGDVSLSGVLDGHIVQVVNGYWQNKLFKSNTIACGGTEKISSYDNATGTFTCTSDTTGTDTNTAQIFNAGGTSLIKQRLNATAHDLKGLTTTQGITLTANTNDVQVDTNFKIDTLSTIATDRFVSAFDNATGDWSTKIFSINSITSTCSGTDKVSAFSIDNSTGFVTVTCSTDQTGAGGGFTKINNVGSGTIKLVQTNSSNTANIKSLSSGQGITLTNGTTSGTIATSFKIDTQSATNDFQIVGFDNSTGDFTRNQFSVNTITCSGNDKISAINNVTGAVTCTSDTTGTDTNTAQIFNAGGTSLIKQRLNATAHDLKGLTTTQGITLTANTNDVQVDTNFKIDTLSTIATDRFVSAFDNATGDWSTKIFSINSITSTCSGTDKVSAFSIDNSTGFVTVTCSTDQTGAGGGFTKINNVGSGTIKLVQTNSSNTANIKSLSSGQGITLTNGTTSGTIATSFKIDTQSATNDFQIVGFDNSTGDFTRNQFSVNTITCSGNDKISAINNVTGAVTCSTDQTGAGGGISEINSMNGGNARILKSNSTTEAVLKSLTAGSGISITNGTDTITIATSGAGPSVITNKRWGSFIPNSATALGDGILGTTASLDGTETLAYNTTRGVLSISSATGTTASANAGISQVTANFNLFRGDQNAYLRIEAAPAANVQGSTTRTFIGFQSGATQLPNAADTIVNALSAAGICKRTTDTAWQICTNDGAGTGTYATTGITADTNWHIFEVYTTDSGVNWCVKIDGGTATCASSDIPATTTRLYFNANTETTGAPSKNFIYGYVFVQNDK